ncbi:MAG: thioredoxin family protein [Clostridiales bacterium]|nr:thioredoxin family protein [Clostridiales bacterium]
MALFGKKKKKTEKCCCGECDAASMKEAEASKKEARGIKVLGTGCAKCSRLETSVGKALEQLGIDEKVEHVTDFSEIASYGVMTTPALVIDGKVVSYGKELDVNQVVEMLKKVRD